MARQYRVLCKRCQEYYIEYSEESYLRMLDRGHSRPAYCGEKQNNCLAKHKEEKSSAAIDYYHLTPVKGFSAREIEPGGLGAIHHPEREHVLTEKEGKFDKEKFGITPDNIREIYEWFRNPEHRVVIVEGPTGSGKSTALPYWLLEPPEGIPSDFFTRDGQILVTEPRIVATEGVSSFISELLGSGLGKGHEIGYRHSKDRNRDWRNRAFQTTDGSLINMIQKGELGNLSIVMIDEAHERSLNIDVILRLLKKQLPLYPHLKLIIASATINAPRFAEYFGQDTAKIVSLEGQRKYEYKEFYAPEEEELPYDDIDRLEDMVTKAAAEKILWLLDRIVEGDKEHGDILAFLHGTKEIEETLARLRKAVTESDELSHLVKLYPLYADLPKEERDIVSQEGNDSQVRVIVSTNVAEASVTVEGVVYVVETGLEKQAQWNKDTLVTEIVTVLTSQANAEQRWGRSGRTRPGEVYCLYTEEQFKNLMDEYPTPDIQRSSMEDVILNAKAAGIDDIETDWLDTPDEEEIERASLTLREEGAVDEDGLLTEYGYLLRYFPYTKELADLVMIADRFGCAIEVATLLPIIKNGGFRHILMWDWDWDAYTKRDVAQIHRALMRGCHDDIEFCLKLYSIWKQLPGTEGLEGDEKEKTRLAWSRANFVNHEVFKDVEEDRDKLLQTLYGHRKDKNYREIGMSLVDRVRILLAYSLPGQRDKGISVPGSGYTFDPKMEPELGSSATYKAVLLPEWKVGLDSLDGEAHSSIYLARYLNDWEKQSRNTPRVTSAYTRLFLDQVFPVGSRYECTVTKAEEDFAEVEVGSATFKKQSVEEIYRISEEEEEFDTDDTEEESVEAKFVDELGFEDMTYQARLDFYEGFEIQEEDVVEGEVVDFEFDDFSNPTVVFSLVPDPRPFDIFVEKYEEYDVVEVEVVGYEEYPGDFRPALVVREVETGFEALMEPEQLSFTYTPSLVRRFPVGFTFEVMIEEIDEKIERVYLSLLPLAEKKLRQILEDQGGKGNTHEVMAEVLEVREDGNVFLELEWSEPSDGFHFLVQIGGRKLFKPPEEFEKGEAYKLKVSTGDKDAYANLPTLPDKLETQLIQEGEDGLYWSRGKLRYPGRLTYDKLFEYKTLYDSEEYHRALEKIYWYSNKLWVTQVEDVGWVDRLKQDYPIGTKLEGVEVKLVRDTYLFLQLEDGVDGFVHGKLTYNGQLETLEPGDKVDAIVSDIDEEKLSVVLDLRIPEDDPILQFEVDQIVEGVVQNGVKKYGAFVELENGFTALAHQSKLFGGVSDAREHLKPGDVVTARIVSIDLDNRKMSLEIKEE